jgi:hypothetical protein
MILAASGVNVAALTSNVPFTAKLPVLVTAEPLPEATVRLLNVIAPAAVLLIDAPCGMVIVPPPDASKFDVELPVDNAPAMVKSLEVVTVAPAAIATLKRVSVPLFVMFDPLFMVIVPEVDVNVPVTLSEVPTVALTALPVIVPLTFSVP